MPAVKKCKVALMLILRVHECCNPRIWLSYRPMIHNTQNLLCSIIGSTLIRKYAVVLVSSPAVQGKRVGVHGHNTWAREGKELSSVNVMLLVTTLVRSVSTSELATHLHAFWPIITQVCSSITTNHNFTYKQGKWSLSPVPFSITEEGVCKPDYNNNIRFWWLLSQGAITLIIIQLGNSNSID